MATRNYSFETANGLTVDVSVYGVYIDGGKDITVLAVSDQHDDSRDFEEVHDADEIMGWLTECGAVFESARSFAFNKRYIESVLIDEDMDEAELLDEAATWSDELLAKVVAWNRPNLG